jgi:hypothetical protein
VAGAGASLDVPLGHKDDSWSFPHFDTFTVSVADGITWQSAHNNCGRLAARPAALAG